MAAVLQICWIARSDEKQIVFLGGEIPGLGQWKLTQQQAIDGMEDEKWKFFVQLERRCVWIVVARSHDNQKYIKAIDDAENLMLLPQSPAS